MQIDLQKTKLWSELFALQNKCVICGEPFKVGKRSRFYTQGNVCRNCIKTDYLLYRQEKLK